VSTLIYEAEHVAFRRSFATLCERTDADDSALGPAGEAGFLGVQVPEELGGAGVDDPLFLAIGIEELCRLGRTGAALGYAIHAGVVLPAIVAGGGHALAEDVVPALAEGTASVGLVLSGVAARDTDGRWRLDGASRTVVGAAGARHLLVVFDDGGTWRAGLVGTDEPGVTLVEQGARALGGAGIAEVQLDSVSVDRSRVLADAAYDDLVAGFRLWVSVVALHGARRALDLTADYVRDRKVFGRPLSEFDNTRSMIGRVVADLAQAQHCVEWGLLRRRDGDLSAAETAVLVLSATQTFHDAADAGLQLHGGYGYMREYPISGTFADAQLLLLLGGVTDPISDLADTTLGTRGG
jgi:acyl-CoA dehydrogenase